MTVIARVNLDRFKILDADKNKFALLNSVAQIPGVVVTEYDDFQGKHFNVEVSKTALPAIDQFLSGMGLMAPSFMHARRRTNDWAPARNLFKHQVDAVEFLAPRGGGLLADVMGLGKTTTAIVSAEQYARCYAADSRLPRVIIGPKYLKDTWKKELKTLGAVTEEEQFCALATKNIDSESWNGLATWYFVHYDIVDTWWSRLYSSHPCAVILDEAHLVKNPRTARYRGVEKAMLSAPFRLCLTGTPLLNRPEEIWSILNLVGGKWSWGTKRDFLQRYAGGVFDGFGWRATNITNKEEFQSRLETCYIRRTLADTTVELPSITRVHMEVEIKQTQELRDLLRGYSVEFVWNAIKMGHLRDEILEWLNRFRKYVSRAKIETTVEIAKTTLEQEESIVIFCWERAIAEEIANRLAGAVITGADTTDVRTAKIDAFMEKGGALVATYGALSVGVTLTKARYVVMHDLDWVPATLLQAEARVYRIGQTRGVTSYWLFAKDTVDQKLAQSVLEKADVIERMINDLGPQALKQALPDMEDEGPWAAREFLTSWGLQ